ncbi:MAG TPA: VTT domain-containing protein [Mycobacterium sp.]|nr:VTT domain-containing protein [Mycobacterium sp.]
MSTATMALPHLMDPMYWIGPGGLFASAVLPGILVIVFIETGLLFPVLPGDSLLFTGGLLAAGGTLSIWTLLITVPLVAIAGDQTAYFIGRGIGPALFDKEDSRFFKKRYVTESHEFFEKHGPFTIILARFVPIVRTFTPVIAGVSKMRYPVFLGFDIVGGIAWGCGVTLLGYFLGNIDFVKRNLELMILLIVFVSIVPGIISVARGLLARRRAQKEPSPVE